MKQFVKKTGKRLTAFLLCGIMCLMAMPMSAFAFTAEVGKTVDASYGGWYLGSDGKYYETDAYKAIIYDTSGNVTVRDESAHHRTKLMISDSTGTRQIMCIESGVDYNAGGTLKSVNGENSSYFQMLPFSAQYGLMLTSLYGWAPGKSIPVSGCNEDDFSIATQSILWEFQQQLRTSPTARKDNAYGIPANTYYNCIKGRPAEKCYDWILSQMAKHATVPSFCSNQSNSAKVECVRQKR